MTKLCYNINIECIDIYFNTSIYQMTVNNFKNLYLSYFIYSLYHYTYINILIFRKSFLLINICTCMYEYNNTNSYKIIKILFIFFWAFTSLWNPSLKQHIVSIPHYLLHILLGSLRTVVSSLLILYPSIFV